MRKYHFGVAGCVVSAGFIAALLLGQPKVDHVAPTVGHLNGGASAAPFGDGAAEATVSLVPLPAKLAGRVAPSAQAQDLYKFAIEALASDDPAFKYEAWTATRQCRGFLHEADRLGTFVAGGDAPEWLGKLTAERVAAYYEVSKRCAGFAGVGIPETTKIAAKLREQGIQANSVEFAVAEISIAKPLPGELLSQALQSRSPEAFNYVLPWLWNNWAISSGQAVDSPQYNDMRLAMQLASCSLGTYCDTDGWQSQFRCVMYGMCSAPLYAEWDSKLSSEDRGQVLAYESQFLNAVKTGDYQTPGFLGPLGR